MDPTRTRAILRASLMALSVALIYHVATPTAIGAQVYSWVDEDGARHFGDRPPPERPEMRPETVEPVQALELPLPPKLEVPEPSTAVRANARGPDPHTLRRRRCADARAEQRALRERQNAPYSIQEGARIDARRRELRILILRDC